MSAFYARLLGFCKISELSEVLNLVQIMYF